MYPRNDRPWSSVSALCRYDIKYVSPIPVIKKFTRPTQHGTESHSTSDSCFNFEQQHVTSKNNLL